MGKDLEPIVAKIVAKLGDIQNELTQLRTDMQEEVIKLQKQAQATQPDYKAQGAVYLDGIKAGVQWKLKEK